VGRRTGRASTLMSGVGLFVRVGRDRERGRRTETFMNKMAPTIATDAR
jgi:hypothetical protein